MGKKKSKKSIVFIEGSSGFIIKWQIKLTDKGMTCNCNSTLKECKHIKNLLIEKKVPEYVLEFYPKFRETISNNYFSPDLIDKIDSRWKIIMSDNCGMCITQLDQVRNCKKFVMCTNCYKLAHEKCYYKSRPDKNGCMYCRHK